MSKAGSARRQASNSAAGIEALGCPSGRGEGRPPQAALSSAAVCQSSSCSERRRGVRLGERVTLQQGGSGTLYEGLQERCWNGQAWAEDVRPLAPTIAAPPPAPVPVADPLPDVPAG